MTARIGLFYCLCLDWWNFDSVKVRIVANDETLDPIQRVSIVLGLYG
jgi:hypothetical protein